MRILTIAFQGAAIAATLGVMSMFGHKAASDYCQIAEAPSPFDPRNLYNDTAQRYAWRCETLKSLAPYNLLYDFEEIPQPASGV